MTEHAIEPGQQWRRKSDGALVTIHSQAGDPMWDDWNVRNEGSKSTRRIFGWNLHRLYELVSAVPADTTGERQ